MRTIGAGIFLSAVTVLGSQVRTQESALTRQLGTLESGAPLTMSLPLFDSLSLRQALGAVSVTARLPIGLELVKDEPFPERVRPSTKGQGPVALSGRRVDEAVDLLLASAPELRTQQPIAGYRFGRREVGSVLHISPFNGRQTFLDTKVQSLELKDAPFHVVGSTIHKLFNASYRDSREPSAGSSFGSGPLKPHLLDRPVSLSVTNGTVREVLDAAIKAHSEAYWVVIYADTSGSYLKSEIQLCTFNGTCANFQERQSQTVR